MAEPARPSPALYKALVLSFVVYSLITAFYMATRPAGRWRSPFSYHPFFMVLGMIGCSGIAAVTKKLGGYANTKLHGVLAMLGTLLALCGVYSIYLNKEKYERPHLTSLHGKVGAALVLTSVGVGMVGAVFLHPDFGIDKTNKQIRYVHKLLARIILGIAWITSFQGMYKMTQDPMTLFIFGFPLLVLFPFTLL